MSVSSQPTNERPTRARSIAIALICAVCVALTLTTVSCNDLSGREVLATVNGQPITRADLDKKLRETRGASVLLQMVDEILVEQEATAQKITATPERLKSRMEQAEANAGSRADLEATLKKHGMSMDAFQKQLTDDVYLDEIARQKTTVTDQEIGQYYKEHAKEFSRGDRVKARMILLESRENADAVTSALAAGGEFNGLAKTFSTDPATKDKGGDMGVIERKDYAKPITEVAFSQKDNQISKPFKTPDGWAIVQTLQHVSGGALPLGEVRKEIEARLNREKLQAVREEWVAEKRANAQFSIPDPALSAEIKKLVDGRVPPTIGQP
jgi:foldase protein PrsA